MSHRHHSKEKILRVCHAWPGFSGYTAGFSGPCYPEPPDVCSREKNTSGPEFPGLYPESPGNPDPMTNFRWRGINTPPYPFSHLSCQVYELNTHPSNRKLSHSPFYILEWFLWGIWVRVKQEQGFVLVSLIPIFWAFGFGQARGFQVCYSWSLVLLDG